MIPLSNIGEYEIVTYPTKTYAIDLEKGRITGYVDEQEAMKQAIFLALSTERFDYAIYDHNYGITLKDLFGKDKYIACAVLERRIRDALSADDRIASLTDFEFETAKNTVHVTFTANTIFGKVSEEVNFNV